MNFPAAMLQVDFAMPCDELKRYKALEHPTFCERQLNFKIINLISLPTGITFGIASLLFEVIEFVD